MEKMKYSDIMKLSDKEIGLKIENLNNEIFKLKIKMYTATLEKPHLLKTMKTDIARLMTAKRAKELKN
ncbi:MAG: 50S ribosomal protein L29 [Oligoflexia bacterium]|nr:50S ribosomal protein L29 [Oligoflexia bacterium]